MNLHAEASGRGRPLVLLHGWGFHSGIWGGLAERLARGRRLIRVDLPGHGHSADSDFASLDGLVDDIAAAIPDEALVAGWSLGGLAALRLATRHRAKVRALALIAETDQPLAHVAAATGFTTQSQLTTVFRRATGFTPAAYRRGRRGSKSA